MKTGNRQMSVKEFLLNSVEIKEEPQQQMISKDTSTRYKLEYSRKFTMEMCLYYLDKCINEAQNSMTTEFLTQYNTARIKAYKLLKSMINYTPAYKTVLYARERAVELRNGKYSISNSGQYEVYRMWGVTDINKLVSEMKFELKSQK